MIGPKKIITKLNSFSHPNFPNSYKQPFVLTSPKTTSYNCIAWAFGDDTKWYWPEYGAFWPKNISYNLDIASFIQLYELVGYLICEDGTHQKNIEKIVLFTDKANIPTHAARQLHNGNWTNKLGNSEDIEHTIYSMSNGFYGKPHIYMARPLNKWSLLYLKHFIILFYKHKLKKK